MNEYFLTDEWASYSEGSKPKLLGIPPTLDEIRAVDLEYVNPLDMSGPDFLYTHHALGLSGVLVGKLRTLVSGKERQNAKRVTIDWKTINGAFFALEVEPTARRLFGTEAMTESKKLVEKLES